jgi:dipeptide transport system substrate-binding protein
MKRQLLMVAAASALVLGMSAVANAKTLVYCSEASPEGFNPQFFDGGNTIDATRQIFNRLVQFKPGSTEIVPGLAEKWSISDDGTEYTFHLRKNVKFNSNADFKPTRDLTADDVVYSFERQQKADNPFHKVSGGTYVWWENLGMGDLVDSVSKVDDHTVKIKLKNREVAFLSMIALDWAAIQSKEYADAMLKANTPEKIDQAPIGTGPFALASYEKDSVIRYVANPHYWNGKQHIDKLVFAITPDPSVRKAKLEAHECDVANSPAPADLPDLAKNKELVVMRGEGMNVFYIAMNTTKKPFDDVRVRQALNMAIDKQAILKSVYQGTGVEAHNVIPPTLWSYDKSITGYPHDPEKAKALLKEAGVPDLTFDFWYQPVTRAYNPDGKKIGELMQQDLAKIGVKANLTTMDWKEYLKRGRAGDHLIMQIGWIADYPDPDDFMFVLLGCPDGKANPSNFAKWCNKDYNDLVMKAKQTADTAQRTKLYQEAQKIAAKEAPWVPVAYAVNVLAASKKVKNMPLDPLFVKIFEGVDKS